MKQNRILYDSDINLEGKPLVDMKHFPASVKDCNSREEFIEAIQTSGFLSLEALNKKLKSDWIGDHISLNDLLEYWNVNYVEIYINELKRMGWTKKKLKDLILATPTYDNTDFNKTVKILFQSETFYKEYEKISWMFLSDVVIFKLFQIDFKKLLKIKKIQRYVNSQTGI